MKKVFLAFLLLLIVVVIALPNFTKQNTPRKNMPDASSSYWVVNMSNNKTLTHTSVPLSVGDEYIAANNKAYRIIKIVKDKAYVEQIE